MFDKTKDWTCQNSQNSRSSSWTESAAAKSFCFQDDSLETNTFFQEISVISPVDASHKKLKKEVDLKTKKNIKNGTYSLGGILGVSSGLVYYLVDVKS